MTQRIVAVMLVLSALLFVGCTFATQETQPRLNGVPVTAQAETSPEIQAKIDLQLRATPMPNPPNLMQNGFSFYEDNTRPAGFDPLFAVCNGKAARLMQNGDGWDIEHITQDELSKYPELSNTGQRSDYMHYVFIPDLAEIHLVDDNGKNLKNVTSFHGEYNPEYWIWAWSSLMFIKDCHLRIFYIRKDGTSKFYKFDL
jgi:hypothetical protein